MPYHIAVYCGPVDYSAALESTQLLIQSTARWKKGPCDHGPVTPELERDPHHPKADWNVGRFVQLIGESG